MNKLKTQEEFCNEILDKFCNKIDVVGKYTGSRNKLEFHCNACGNNWDSAPYSILHTDYGCPKCADAIISEKLSHKTKYGKFVDLYPELANRFDIDKNFDIDINLLSCKSGKYVWWKCEECGYSWRSKVASIVNNKGNCPNCYLKNAYKGINKHRLKRDGSFADAYPELLSEWDYDKNFDIDPYKLLVKSNKKVWWKCQCGHEWEAKIAKRTEGHNCPFCFTLGKSGLQRKFMDYYNENYSYNILHEFKCTLQCRNPKTGFLLPYDNEIILTDTYRLIVECNGEQHYLMSSFAKQQAQRHNTTPQEEFEYQQWKDEYKEKYAIDNGYYYLAIPYYSFKDDSYKTIIDSKIHEILHKIIQRS